MERHKFTSRQCHDLSRGLARARLNLVPSFAWAGAWAERSLDTVVRAVSAAVLPVWVDFTSLKGLPCPRAGTGDDPKGHAGD